MTQDSVISLIICTHNRYDMLARCIDKLNASIDHSDENIELIIVDNTPADIRTTIAGADRFRIVYCDQLGLSYARNMGIEICRGDIVAFIDDDALIDANWIQACRAAFQDTNRLVVGGAVHPAFEGDLPFWYYDELSYYLSCIDWSTSPRHLTEGEWIVGANMAFRKEFFEKFGYFATNLGRSGSRGLLSNEEVALMERYGKSNIWYEPRMKVSHIIPQQRITVEWFRSRVFWQAVSDVLGNLSHLTRKDAAEFLDAQIIQLHPRYRGLKTFFRTPVNKSDFEMQLKGLYAYIRCAAEGEY